jgi:hypothetical protein
MFNLVFHSVGQPVFNPHVKDDLSDQIEKRQQIVLNFIKELAQLAGLNSSKLAELTARPLSDLLGVTPAAGGSTVYFPSLLLLNLEELGLEFKVTSLEELDKKLEQDPQWLQNLADRLAIVCKKDPVVVTLHHRESIRLMVRYLFKEGQISENAMDGLKFVVLHEIGHIKHEHSLHRIPQDEKKWMLIGGTIAAALASIVCLAVSATLFGLLITVPIILTAFGIGAFAAKKIKEIQHNRMQEREADLFAMQALKDKKAREKVIEGGRYLFETIRTHRIELLKNSRLPWKERLLFNLAIDPEGNNRFSSFTHPSDTERRENIKKEAEKNKGVEGQV